MLSPPRLSQSEQKQLHLLQVSVCVSPSLSHPLRSQRTWCFRFRMFPLAPFGEALSCSRYSPCDLTTAGLLTCCSDDVKADRASNTRGKSTDQPTHKKLFALLSEGVVSLQLLTFESLLTFDMCLQCLPYTISSSVQSIVNCNV